MSQRTIGFRCDNVDHLGHITRFLVLHCRPKCFSERLQFLHWDGHKWLVLSCEQSPNFAALVGVIDVVQFLSFGSNKRGIPSGGRTLNEAEICLYGKEALDGFLDALLKEEESGDEDENYEPEGEDLHSDESRSSNDDDSGSDLEDFIA